MQKFDVAIIGAGAAGITAAKTAHGFGKKVVLIEPNKIGGECTWTGCVPSKSLIKSAEIAHHIQHADQWGVTTDTYFKADKVFDYIKNRILQVYQHTTPDTFEAMGITVIEQSCYFVDNHTLECADGTKIRAKYSVICTGSRPSVAPIDGLSGVAYKTNVNFFDQEQLPNSLIILGGGPIGAEMASACNRLGVRVTLIEMQDRILPREDAEIVSLLTKHLRNEGVDIRTGLKAVRVEQDEQFILTCIDQENREHRFKANQLLVAVGRQPNTEGLGLEKAGVETTKKGISTDRTMRTTARNIYACGDVVGPYLFSHMAWQQAVLAVRNISIPLFKKKMNYEHVIWATFTAPECASAGMTEQKAIDTFGKKNVNIYRQPYKTLDRAITDNAQTGLVKMVCDAKGKLVGIHIFGAHASDIIHEAQLAKWYGISLQKIQPVIHAYPTYAELIWQTGKKAYVQSLMRNPFIRFVKWLSNTSS